MIRVENLRYRYPKTDKPALHDLNFDIAEGEIFGFLGPSGAGKSTTQKILYGLLKGYQGEVQVMGKELRDWGKDYFERVGVGFELPNHYLKLTGLENLSYFQSLYSTPTEDPQALLELVGLQEAAKIPVAQYSKGMQSRLTFVRALLNKPRLLFLDEPTSGLDPINARRVKDIILARRAAGATVFLTTHNMNVAEELCDRVAFITDGSIRAVGTPNDLKRLHGKRIVHVEYGPAGQLSRCEFPMDGLGHNQAFLGLLQRDDVHAIHSQEATLETVFIETTGRHLS